MLPRAVFSSRLRLLPDGRLTSRDRQVTAKLQNSLAQVMVASYMIDGRWPGRGFRETLRRRALRNHERLRVAPEKEHRHRSAPGCGEAAASHLARGPLQKPSAAPSVVKLTSITFSSRASRVEQPLRLSVLSAHGIAIAVMRRRLVRHPQEFSSGLSLVLSCARFRVRDVRCRPRPRAICRSILKP